jgi:hypothetical protein
VTQSGSRLHLVTRGIQRVPIVGGLLGAVTISTQLFDRGFSQVVGHERASLIKRVSIATLLNSPCGHRRVPATAPFSCVLATR